MPTLLPNRRTGNAAFTLFNETQVNNSRTSDSSAGQKNYVHEPPPKKPQCASSAP